MNNFIIVTDACCDLPLDYVKEQGVDVIPLNLKIGDKTYKDDLGQSISSKEFYEKISNGALPMTSQPTPDAFYQVFKKSVVKGESVLYIGVSSGLSGTYNSSNIAKNMIEEEFENANIVCFTTLTASLGQGLFVMKAVEMKNEGKTLEEIVEYLSEKVKSQKNLIIMNDLSHLKRGGRISGVQSAIGSALKINPVVHINKEGKVEIIGKIRGRKKAINSLIEFVCDNIEYPQTQTVAISHSNVLNDAEKVKNGILERLPVKNIVMESVGPAVGSHSGEGAVVVFFLN